MLVTARRSKTNQDGDVNDMRSQTMPACRLVRYDQVHVDQEMHVPEQRRARQRRILSCQVDCLHREVVERDG